MRYYISDLHYFHKNVIKMDKRLFPDVDAMHEHMIAQWNNRVKTKDEVIVLGDLSFGNGEQTNEILCRLNGMIYLIEGNHDHKFLKDKNFDTTLLEWVKPYCELHDNNRKIVLSHYPICCYNGQYRKRDGNPFSYMLYGHVHNTQDQKLVDDFVRKTRQTLLPSLPGNEPSAIPCHMINCFCMYSDYVPLTLDEWIQVNEDRIRN